MTDGSLADESSSQRKSCRLPFGRYSHVDLIVCEEDLAYTAGIVDGEGCITILKSRKDERVQYTPRVTVKMCDTNPILFLKRKFGGGVSRQECEPPRRDAYYWYLDDKHSVKWLLMRVLPYLRVKARQAELLLEFIAKTPQKPKSQRFDSQEIERRESLYQEIRQLNERGRETG